MQTDRLFVAVWSVDKRRGEKENVQKMWEIGAYIGLEGSSVWKMYTGV